MKKLLIILYFSINATFLCAQTILSIEGTTINNADPASWNGVNIPRSVPTTFTYRNNSITSVNAFGYMLQAGDEGVSATKNNLAGEVISGNVFTWNGTNGNSITHGVFTGYNNNAIIKYNYLNKVPMGIIRKSNGMTDTTGGIAYNIVKDGLVAVNIKGMNGICIYNNTFYSTKTVAETYRGIIHVYSNDSPVAASKGTKVKNNIFYTKHQISNITINDAASVKGFESDYNIFWCEEGTPMFGYAGLGLITFAKWQALGYDTHSVVLNPDFIDSFNFVPRSRLDLGTNLGATWQSGLSTNAFWGLKDPDTANQNGTWQTGSRVYRVNQSSHIPNQGFQLNENSPNGTLVGKVVANDFAAGQKISFSILSGNTNGAFAINDSTGIITVAASAVLDYELIKSFSLIIKVQDIGVGHLSSQTRISVTLLDVNEPPVIINQTFSVNENSANGTIVGTVKATNPEPGQAIAYSILSGNKNNAFAIHSTTGAVTVANSAALDYQTDPSFSLVVQVQDNGPGNLSSHAIVKIALIYINESPVIGNQSFSVNENSANGTVVDTVKAIDPNKGQSLTFSILSGNEHNAFSINSSTGVITVANATAIDIKVNPAFMLVVNVLDDGIGALSSSATVLITVINKNDPRFRANKYFIVNEFAPKRTVVGTLAVSRPVAGAFLAYAIVSGNNSQAFTISSSGGSIVVNNQQAINYSINPLFQLTIAVQDSTSGQLPLFVAVNIYVMNTSNSIFGVTGGTQSIAGQTHPNHIMDTTGTETIITDPANALPGWIQYNGNGSGKSGPIPDAIVPGLNPENLNNVNNSIQGKHQILLSQEKTSSGNGISEQSVLGIHLFPNPLTNGFLNVKLDDGIQEEFDLSILDFSGKLMLQKHYENTNPISIDLSAYPPALYLIYIRSLHFRFSDKLIIL